ncbi:MAG: YdcF family protein [Verrucomicrobiae bacterium]|nr:YdcF family protein [Verrucomicrobiae bacterium]
MRRPLVILGLVPLLLFFWFWFSPWPNPENRPVPWVPDAIVVLGGGDSARAREASRLAGAFPDAPLIVTGDGGHMESLLRADPVTRSRLIIEPHAKSTWENATYSEPLLEQIHATRALIVTNWFHAPRAEAVFRKAIPWMEWECAFETAPDPLAPWDRGCHRREKLASLWYLMRYGVNSFAGG